MDSNYLSSKIIQRLYFQAAIKEKLSALWFDTFTLLACLQAGSLLRVLSSGVAEFKDGHFQNKVLPTDPFKTLLT